MRRLSLLRFVAVLLTVVAAGTLSLRAAVPNRITSAVSDARVEAREGSVSPRVRGAVDQGRLSGATPLTALSINFLPSTEQQAALDALLQAQQDPASSSYHKWLTPAQFGAQFGMSDSDLAAVTAWLQSHGLQVSDIAPSRNAIHFSGTAAQVEQAFQTELHALTIDGEAHFANITAPMLPSAFAGTVAGVRGLNDFRPKPHVRVSKSLVPYGTNGRQVHANATPVPQTTDGTGIEYISPEDFAKIYNVTALYNAGFNGSASYPVGIVGQTAIKAQDITDFRSSFGLTSNAPTMVLVPNTGSSAVNSTDDLAESELDLEWSGAVAPNAPIYFIYTGNSSSGGYLSYDVFNALQYAIQSYTFGNPAKPLPILSISYGECEPSDTAADFATYESWFKQANAQGQTIISASGDEGSAGCDYSTSSRNNYAANQGLAVDYPASSAYVTGVGGTSYSGDLTSLSTYWGSSNDTNYGNELGLFIPSTSWNNTPSATAAASYAGLSASGGGVSALWPKPAWQTGVAGIPNDGKRDVPDIALNADPDHDGYLVCINGGCEGANASFNVYGGTSVSAPSFAGILALAEQRLGTYEGNLNPLLYGVAAGATGYNGSSAFHDITTGSNLVPCVVASTDTGCGGGTMGYSAGTGYDLVTGLGAVDAFNLTNALSGTAAKAATSNALSYAPSTIVTGQAVTFTATVATSSAGTAPTGSVTFSVDGGTPSAGVAVSGGVAAFSTTFSTGGAHTVAAVYSGDTNYYGSTSTISVTVAVAVNPNNIATTTGLVASPASPTAVPLGSSLLLTATVSNATAGGSLAGLTGKVTFTASPSGLVLGRQTVTVSGTSATAALSISVARLSLPIGQDTITATFDGGGMNAAGGSYLASPPSAAVAVNVTNPSINITATNVTVTNGSAGNSTISLSSAGGYSGTITLQATTSSTVLLTYATATFNPATVVLTSGGSGTATVTFTTATTINGAAKGAGKLTLSSALRPMLAGGGLSLAGLLCLGLTGTRRRRLPSMLLSLMALALLGGVMGCGSSSSSGGGSTTRNNIPTGVYTITIVGTDSSAGVTGSTNITLTIK